MWCVLGNGWQHPLVSVHDVGAGGLSNAMHELVHEWDLGLLNPARELIRSIAFINHPCKKTKIVVFNNNVPFRGYHVVPYNVITPKCHYHVMCVGQWVTTSFSLCTWCGCGWLVECDAWISSRVGFRTAKSCSWTNSSSFDVSHPSPHAETKVVVFNNGVPFRGYHVVPYNVITPNGRLPFLCDVLGNGWQHPLVSVHDVGAGGLSNAMHELVHEWDLGLLNPTRELIQASHSTTTSPSLLRDCCL